MTAETYAARHVALGAVAGGAAAVRVVLGPVRLIAYGVVSTPPMAPLRRLATASATELARSGVRVERRLIATGERLGRDLARIAVERALTSPDTEALITRTLERPELERLIVLALDSPAMDRIVQRVLAAPGVERAVTRVLESELLDAATARFLESDEIERVIERIAHGPELRAAVAAQSAGLADMVAEEVRGRSVAADDVAERLARSLIPRRWRHGPTPGAAGP